MATPLLLEVPALAQGVYPERPDRDEKLLDRIARLTVSALRRWARPDISHIRLIAQKAEDHAHKVAGLTDDALRQTLGRIARTVVREGKLDECALALAVVSEATTRSLGIRPYPTQLMGAYVLLSGRLAEMATGEGKTLTAALAASIAGMAGLPTHVVTVNDYLAQRDAEEMGPLYRLLGLSVGKVITGMDHEAKRHAYACDVTYCTNKDLVFDYLRDRVTARGRASQAQVRVRALHGEVMAPLLLRGLYFAIIDEADSILIDEARTPLILSQKSGRSPDPTVYQQALTLASELVEGEHYEVDSARHALHLTASGQIEIGRHAVKFGGIWRVGEAREHLISQALRALHLFHRDQHYLVADAQVHIIDEYTGRILPGRSWEQGLHQMIEAKEGVPLTEPATTLARLTYQRFFCRYLRLAGMTGTAREVAGELRAVYGLDVVVIPNYRPCVRRYHRTSLCQDEAEKWHKVMEVTRELMGEGRPVLIGTRSVEASERLSAVLSRAGLAHCVLNARQDADEAQVVAKAGQPGIVTVATNMAGRGTDIRLAEAVRDKGGLTVILTEFHEAARIDRQLYGRCARQGDPGEVRVIVALTDELFRAHGGWLYRVLSHCPKIAKRLPLFWAGLLRRLCQYRAQGIHARTRRHTLKQDRKLDNLLGFAGKQI